MYKVLTIKDTVRVPPKRFDEDLDTVIKTEFAKSYNGRIVKNVGVILSVIEVKDVSEGKIIMGDGAIYYDSTLEALVYRPVLNEVVEGYVTELAEFGAFVNFGPFDGLIHLSQITEDYMSYDQKSSAIVGRETHKTLKVEDDVKARIVAISMKRTLSDSKIGLTMRQPYLGKKEWANEKKRGEDAARKGGSTRRKGGSKRRSGKKRR